MLARLCASAAGGGAMAAITDMFSRYPETMTCMGRDDHGILLLWGIINRSHDLQLLPFLLDSARDHKVSLLLPYSPQVRRERCLLACRPHARQHAPARPAQSAASRPASMQNIAILTRADYQLVAAIIDTIVQMHEAGDETTASLLSTGATRQRAHAQCPAVSARGSGHAQ